MSGRVDWVPTQEEKLVELIADWRVKLSNHALRTAYGWPADECTQTEDAFTTFLDARTVYRTTPTKANRIEKDELRKDAIDAMRKFARERIRNNGKMNDGQKQEMGVTASDREPSPVPIPDAGPDSEALISAREPGVIKIRYLGAKPYGVDRIEIAWTVSHTPIDSPELLTHNGTFSRNPWERTFSAAERAKKLYYSLRYLTKGGESHWSDVREVVIP
ncbi:MAG: hypothetical protein LBH75_00355 [Treponema sp.]|nr:hypothetical protein [Treponema sp.]